ncbi:cyclic AMP-responsive element-binding protein 3-like [Bolinopsis microptera]|uniref:cyclic AMP-responsive element-binding protein 3-like n=1 Tax=Bolinopsis microptera TaxID=2820187 RepID=UPI00307934EE
MADSVIDHLFDDAISSDLPMPGAELDFFLDHLPVDDTSTFSVKEILAGGNRDLWEFDPDVDQDNNMVKKELLSDGGSPDSSGADRYSINSDEERDPLNLNNNLLNVDIFLNKPSGADNDVLVNIPQRTGIYTTGRISHRGRVNTDDLRCSSVKGRDITEEERKMLDEEGVTIPYNVILTKNEERALKRVRRKIKNKISAAESRKRRKEYIGGLERRVEEHTVVNVKLQNTIDELQKRNRGLMEQLKKAVCATKKFTVGSQTTTCLMGILLSFTFFLFPLFSSPFQSVDTQTTSNIIPGRSLLSISDTPKASFIEIIVDYIVEKLDNTMDIYTSTSETVFINNDTLFLT